MTSVLRSLVLAVAIAGALAGPAHAELISQGDTGGNGSFSPEGRRISADGSTVLFQTDEALVASDTDSSIDLYARTGGVTTLASVPAAQTNGDWDIGNVDVSPDGTKVLFETDEPLSAADHDTATDVYLWSGGLVTLISDPPQNGSSDISLDGQTADFSTVYVESFAPLTASDHNASGRDAYAVTAGVTTLVTSGTAASSGGDDLRSVSADGATAIFTSEARLTADDTDNYEDYYARRGGMLTLLTPGTTSSSDDISMVGYRTDGEHFLFRTGEPLSGADTDSDGDIYEHDVSTPGATPATLLTGGANGVQTSDGVGDTSASLDASVLYFETAEALLPGDTDGGADSLYRRTSSGLQLIQMGADTNDPNLSTSLEIEAISPDGARLVVAREVYNRTTYEGTSSLFRVDGATATEISGSAPSESFCGASDDLSSVAFGTTAKLLTSDTDDAGDIYVATGGALKIASQGSVNGNDNEFAACDAISADGSKVLFHTFEQLEPEDTDDESDVYAGTPTVGTAPSPGGTGSTTGGAGGGTPTSAPPADTPSAPAPADLPAPLVLDGLPERISHKAPGVDPGPKGGAAVPLVSKTRTAFIAIRNDNAFAVTALATFVRGRQTLGNGTFTLKPGATTALAVRVNDLGLRLLRADSDHRIDVELQLTVRDPFGTIITVTRSYVLTLADAIPKPSRRRRG